MIPLAYLTPMRDLDGNTLFIIPSYKVEKKRKTSLETAFSLESFLLPFQAEVFSSCSTRLVNCQQNRFSPRLTLIPEPVIHTQ